jgi:itaconate CoA-transferase
LTGELVPVVGTLTGIRVIELGGYLAAPLTCQILGRLGAEIIKVEPVAGEPARVFNSTFVCANAGKRAMVLDLKHAQSREVWRRLVRSSGVIVQNLSKSAAADLDVEYKSCHAINPDIVYCDIKAFGSGPYEDRQATNPLIEALTGLMSITLSDGRPVRQGAAFFDQLTGALGALGVLNALRIDNRGNEGGYVEVDLFETGLFSIGSRLAHEASDGKLGGQTWGTAPYGTFLTLDDRWIFIGVNNDRFWRAFCQVMDVGPSDRLDELATVRQRADRIDEVNEISGAAIRKIARDEVFERLTRVGVPCAPVNQFHDVMQDPHVLSPGKLEAAQFGDRQVMIPAFPMTGVGISASSMTKVPGLGEHTEEILRSLGFGSEQIEELERSGVIASADRGR